MTTSNTPAPAPAGDATRYTVTYCKDFLWHANDIVRGVVVHDQQVFVQHPGLWAALGNVALRAPALKDRESTAFDLAPDDLPNTLIEAHAKALDFLLGVCRSRYDYLENETHLQARCRLMQAAACCYKNPHFPAWQNLFLQLAATEPYWIKWPEAKARLCLAWKDGAVKWSGLGTGDAPHPLANHVEYPARLLTVEMPLEVHSAAVMLPSEVFPTWCAALLLQAATRGIWPVV